MSIAIATCAELPDGDEDAALLRDALAGRGVDVHWQVWNDPDVDWAGYDLVVIRSTWDYTLDLPGFLRWAGSIERLLNPTAVLAWNTDKLYLRELADRGVPIVPTAWFGVGDSVILPTEGEFVVKPSVGAGSIGSGRFTADGPGRAHATEHAAHLYEAGRTVMVQPYLDEVDSAGETALVYLDGKFSHAVRKGPMLAEQAVNPLENAFSRSLFVPERITARTPSDLELAVGDRVVEFTRERFDDDLLYIRVDLLPTSSGPVVIELELTEPSLFLTHDAEAAGRLADAVLARLG